LFDWLIANLPYIPGSEIATLSREVQHDPRLALDGGPVGTELILRLTAQARQHLRPGGRLALEIGHNQAAPLAAALAPGIAAELENRVLAARWMGPLLVTRPALAADFPALSGGALTCLDRVFASPASLVGPTP
jgi:methylase of polypeptide subunit release factors